MSPHVQFYTVIVWTLLVRTATAWIPLVHHSDSLLLTVTVRTRHASIGCHAALFEGFAGSGHANEGCVGDGHLRVGTQCVQVIDVRTRCQFCKCGMRRAISPIQRGTVLAGKTVARAGARTDRAYRWGPHLQGRTALLVTHAMGQASRVPLGLLILSRTPKLC